jgi:hypothetical protein
MRLGLAIHVALAIPRKIRETTWSTYEGTILCTMAYDPHILYLADVVTKSIQGCQSKPSMCICIHPYKRPHDAKR